MTGASKYEKRKKVLKISETGRGNEGHNSCNSRYR